MARIVLADPPRDGMTYDVAYPNMGILQIIAYLRQHRPDLEIHYVEGFLTSREHVAKIAELNPDVYGLSFAYLTQRVALETVKAVRQTCPNAKIVCGGPGPTGQPERALTDSPADCVVLGEGEQTFVELTDALLGGGDLSRVAGIAYRGGGRIVTTPERKLIEDLDSLPMPAWDMVDLSRYVGQHFQRSDRQACIVISRGCPFHCTFCSNPVWRLTRPRVRLRSPERIAEEAERLYAMGIREIKFVSDELNPDLAWAKDVCRAVIALGHRDLFFQTNLRADKVDDELASLLRQMRCWLIHLGAESANDRVLNGIGKRITVEQIERTCRLLTHHGIHVFLFMMAFQLWKEDGTLQWETPQEVARSLRFVVSLRLRRLISYMSWSIATPMPDSLLWEAAGEVNPTFEREVLDAWDQNQDYLGFDLSAIGITRRQRQRTVRRGILTKGLFALLSGRFSFKRHWWRIPVMLKSFLAGSRLGQAKSKG